MFTHTTSMFSLMSPAVYKDAFDAADKEQIGRIARDEIVNVIRRLGFNPIPDEITKMTDKATECKYSSEFTSISVSTCTIVLHVAQPS